MTNSPNNNHESQDLQPAHAMWALYHPEDAPLRFKASTQMEARAWQEKVRPLLQAAIGFQPNQAAQPGDLPSLGSAQLPEAPLDPQRLEMVDKGDYTREKVLLRTSAHTLMPVYILKPKASAGPFPVVLALHGHGYGVKDIVGLWEDGEERDTPDGYHKDFAVALCRRGFLVAAPEISCFGERQSDFSYLKPLMGQEAPSTCHHTAAMAFHLGGSVVGLRVRDGIRLIDYLETRPDADTQRLGAMGLSGGGMHTFFSTCLDPRIRACVVSGYFCPMRYSIFGMHHCTCNYVPGLHPFGEVYDLAGLIAPRPMLVEAGTRDPIFPLAGVEEAVSKARTVYRVFDAEHQLECDYFEGRHRIGGQRAYDFLWEKLA
jgi:dienelactone hydrolase